MSYSTHDDGPAGVKTPLTPAQNVAINALVRLLAPALTDHQGMLATGREAAFRDAITMLISAPAAQVEA